VISEFGHYKNISINYDIWILNIGMVSMMPTQKKQSVDIRLPKKLYDQNIQIAELLVKGQDMR
jgi:hypothetical protein